METVAVAGTGAVGSAVCRALIDGINGFTLTAASDLEPDLAKQRIGRPDYDFPFVGLDKLPAHAGWIIEALPAGEVPALARRVLEEKKTLVMISSAALLLNPELRELAAKTGGRILVPSGALAGIDGINALAESGIRRARLVTTKKPGAFAGSPYIMQQEINLSAINTPTTLFTGNALEAATAFPANINVAATLTLASRLPPENVEVEIYADPAAQKNTHEVFVESLHGTMRFRISNSIDPENPKTSALTSLSIITALRKQNTALWVG